MCTMSNAAAAARSSWPSEEPGDPDVGAAEDAVAVDDPHVGVRVGPVDLTGQRRVDALLLQRRQHHLTGAVGADRAEVGRRRAVAARMDGHVDGVAAGVHVPGLHVPVDDVVADGEQAGCRPVPAGRGPHHPLDRTLVHHGGRVSVRDALVVAPGRERVVAQDLEVRAQPLQHRGQQHRRDQRAGVGRDARAAR